MPSVEISQQTFARLQSHATPLVDTIESLINRLIDHVETSKSLDATGCSGEGNSQVARMFNPGAPPDLTHAKILGVLFRGKPLGRGQDNWNGLLNAAVREAKTQSQSISEFRALMVIKFVEGKKRDEGYRPLDDLGISIQGQDANGAWRGISHIARQLGCQLSVKFAWREKQGAAFPGVIGQFVIAGA